jgi:ribonuclease G
VPAVPRDGQATEGTAGAFAAGQDTTGPATGGLESPAVPTRGRYLPPRPPREVLLSYEDGEPAVAIFEAGRLVEVDFDPPQARRIVGNIYKGRVQNVLPGMQAAFVDVGLERNAFLFVDDAHPAVAALEGEELPEDVPGRAAASITELLQPGQEILVQVTKEAAGRKGPRVTRGLSLPGRYLVLMPGMDYVGVSRRIADPAERERLRSAAQGLRAPGVGLIVRTAAAGVSEDDLAADWGLLWATWQGLLERARRLPAPALVHRDLDVVQRMVRDQLNGDVVRIVVDRPEELERLRALLVAAAPAYAPRLELAAPEELRRGLFTARGVYAEIDRALGRRVPLPSGGYLVIDHTEALTVIDVNTGSFVGASRAGSLGETFLAANLEAAVEIARQIRLRDVGGIVLVDFIDMADAEHRRRVLDALEAACAPDHARPQILGITALGLVEMTRKKSRQSLRELLTRSCPQCEGRGRVLSEETVGRRVRRLIRSALHAHPEAEAVLAEVHPAVARVLIGQGGRELRAFEQELGKHVYVRGAADLGLEEARVRTYRHRHEAEPLARPVREGDILELRVEQPHAASPGDGIGRVQGYVIDVEGGAAHVGRTVKVEVVRTYRTYARARLLSP